jgi:hypothetical protein
MTSDTFSTVRSQLLTNEDTEINDSFICQYAVAMIVRHSDRARFLKASAFSTPGLICIFGMPSPAGQTCTTSLQAW